jgi:hypothetical protein
MWLWDVHDPTLPRQSAHRWWRGCQLSAPAMLCFPEIFFISVSGTDFCRRLSKPQGLVQVEGLGKLVKFNYLIRSSPPACTIVPQPLCYHMPLCVCVCVCACVCVCECARVCVCARVRVRTHALVRAWGRACINTYTSSCLVFPFHSVWIVTVLAHCNGYPLLAYWPNIEKVLGLIPTFSAVL